MNLIGVNEVGRGGVCVARKSCFHGRKWAYDLTADILMQYDETQRSHVYKGVYIYVSLPTESFDSPEYILSRVEVDYLKKTNEVGDPSISAMVRDRVVIRYLPKDTSEFDIFPENTNSKNFAAIVIGAESKDVVFIKNTISKGLNAGGIFAALECDLIDDEIDSIRKLYEPLGLQVIDVDSRLTERVEISNLMKEWAEDIGKGNKELVYSSVDVFCCGDYERAVMIKLCVSLISKDEDLVSELWCQINSADGFSNFHFLMVANIFYDYGEIKYCVRALERISFVDSVVDEHELMASLDLSYSINNYSLFSGFMDVMEGASVKFDKSTYYDLEISFFIKKCVKYSETLGVRVSEKNPHKDLACSLELWWKGHDTLMDIISLISASGMRDDDIYKAHFFLIQFIECSKSRRKVLDVPINKWRLSLSGLMDLTGIYIDAFGEFIRGCLLKNSEGEVAPSYVFTLLQRAACLVALFPHVGEYRERLAKIMSASNLGIRGAIALALSAVDIIKKRDYESLCYEDVLEGGIYDSFIDDFEMVSSAFEGASVNLLDEFPPFPLDDSKRISFLYAVNDFSQGITEHYSRNDIVKGGIIDLLAAVAVFAGKNIESESIDFRVIRNIAISVSHLGEMQRARDLAETILQLSGSGGNGRKRYAWKYFANIYSRCGNSEMAALSMLCSLTLIDKIPWSQAFEEIYDTAAALRDIGLIDEGLGLIDLLSEVAGKAGYSEKIHYRIDFLSATLEFSKISVDSPARDMENLLWKLHSVCLTAESLKAETFPSLHLLSQLVNLVISESETVPLPILKYLEDKMEQIGEGEKRLIDISSSKKKSLSDLCETLAATDSLRYPNDIGYDLRNLVISARIALGGLDAESAVEAAFLCELLSDHSVCYKGGTFKDVALSLSQDFKGVYRSLESFSREGDDVFFIGRGANSKLAKLHFSNGGLSTYSLGWFDRSAYMAWSKKYPYDFLNMGTQDCNLAFAAMESINIDVDDLGRTVFIFDTDMKLLPSNLILSRGDFIGRKKPVCSAPSFTWLNNTKNNFYDNCSGEAIWIPTEGEDPMNPTLNLLDTLIRDVVDSRDIEISNDGIFPASLCSKEMVILGAHGGLKSDNGMFDSISSDSGDTRLYPDQIGPRLEGTKLVILFVCSGGRVDPHPFASSSLGIPQTILNYGCACVIAPAWPLTSLLANKWLSAFLKHWDAGLDAAECNFRSNRDVEIKTGGDILNSLNMHIYGCPDIRKNS